MRKLITIIIISLVSSSLAHAVRGIGIATTIRQADGTQLTIIVRGDEFSRYTTTIDNYQIVEHKGIYYYWPAQAARNATKSTEKLIKANDPSSRGIDERLALQGQAQGRLSTSSNRARLTNTRFSLAPISPSAADATSRARAANIRPKNVLVILVQFQDVKFLSTSNVSSFDYMLNSAPKSAQKYFADNSMNAYIPQFDISPIITLPHNMAYYGANSWNEQMGTNFDERPDEMVRDACLLATQHMGSFAKYDNNGDGFMDNVYILFAGHNEAEGASQDAIWPHQWAVPGAPSIGGVKVSSYTCGSELSGAAGTFRAGIGTFCHEFSHVLGLPDFYDTDYNDNGHTVGLYNLSLMSSGNYNDGGKTPPYFNAFERYMLNWNKLHQLTANKTHTIRPIQEDNDGLFFASKVSQDELYVIEYRNAGRGLWDTPIGAKQGESFSGMLIYHIDASNNESGGGIRAADRWRTNEINCDASHPCMRIINSPLTADADGYNGEMNLATLLFGVSSDQNSFTGRHSQGIDWRGNPIMVELTEITDHGTTMSFSTRSSQGTGQVLNFLASQRSAEIIFSTIETPDRFTIKHKEEKSLSWLSQEVDANKNRLTIEDLLPDTRYNVELWTVNDDKSTLIAQSDFTTEQLTAPFAAIEGLAGNYSVGQSVKLAATNINSHQTSIKFAVDGVPITDNTYVFRVKGEFTISCTIHYSSQDQEIITRKVIVK